VNGSTDLTIDVGSRLVFDGTDVEVIVTRGTAGEVVITCPVCAVPPSTTIGVDGYSDGEIQLGKRYVDAECGIELLCCRAGRGTLQCDGRVLVRKDAKPLPSSD
jgi:hypothetical protein